MIRVQSRDRWGDRWWYVRNTEWYRKRSTLEKRDGVWWIMSRTRRLSMTEKERRGREELSWRTWLMLVDHYTSSSHSFNLSAILRIHHGLYRTRIESVDVNQPSNQPTLSQSHSSSFHHLKPNQSSSSSFVFVFIFIILLSWFLLIYHTLSSSLSSQSAEHGVSNRFGLSLIKSIIHLLYLAWSNSKSTF